MSICVKLNHNGFFTNFNLAVDWLAFGDVHNVPVGIDWRLDSAETTIGPSVSRSASWDFNYGVREDGNLWNLFFEPLPCVNRPNLVVDSPWTEYIGGFRGYRLYNRRQVREHFRRRLHASFRRHVFPVRDIREKIESFARHHFDGHYMIGVHLRNPIESRSYSHSEPVAAYGRCIARLIATLPPHTDWRIFAASDREGLIEEMDKYFPGRVISQTGISRASANSSSEMHVTEKPRRSLGVDVISDCWLLSRCNHLFGRQSSVCTAAMFVDPQMKFTNVQSTAAISAGYFGYYLKQLYCKLYEGQVPQIRQAKMLLATKWGSSA